MMIENLGPTTDGGWFVRESHAPVWQPFGGIQFDGQPMGYQCARNWWDGTRCDMRVREIGQVTGCMRLSRSRVEPPASV